jgi:hypothetical protein
LGDELFCMNWALSLMTAQETGDSCYECCFQVFSWGAIIRIGGMERWYVYSNMGIPRVIFVPPIPWDRAVMCRSGG